jgi:hypothetical protein
MLAVVAVALAIIAGFSAVICASFEPHYAGSANLPDPGFNTWYWRDLNYARMLLPLIAFVIAAIVSVRHYVYMFPWWRRASKLAVLAIGLSVIEIVWFFIDLTTWIPNF